MSRALQYWSNLGTARAGATLLWLAIGWELMSSGVRAQGAPLREYDLKAAFLYNVAKYTDWPQEAFARADDPIVIGILGEDPFGDVLDRVVQGRIINGHPVVIRRAVDVAELKGAHLVFVSSSESYRAAQDCAAMRNSYTVSIGDTDQSAPFTAIGLMLDNDRVSFVVDLNRVARAKANISSQLLRLAKTVVRSSAPSSE